MRFWKQNFSQWSRASIKETSTDGRKNSNQILILGYKLITGVSKPFSPFLAPCATQKPKLPMQWYVVYRCCVHSLLLQLNFFCLILIPITVYLFFFNDPGVRDFPNFRHVYSQIKFTLKALTISINSIIFSCWRSFISSELFSTPISMYYCQHFFSQRRKPVLKDQRFNLSLERKKFTNVSSRDLVALIFL